MFAAVSRHPRTPVYWSAHKVVVPTIFNMLTDIPCHVVDAKSIGRK
jgi:hypothetical protein